MTKKKEVHNEHYHEKGRNGWVPTSTSDELNDNQEKLKDDLNQYVKELESYVR